jgi:hypothetical protein
MIAHQPELAKKSFYVGSSCFHTSRISANGAIFNQTRYPGYCVFYVKGIYK